VSDVAVCRSDAERRISTAVLPSGEGIDLVSVTARKIRDHGRERASLGVGRTYAGYLISYPSVGRGMVIFRDPNGHRMVTTPVKRVLGDEGSETLFVETENSVYQLTFRAEPVRAMPRAAASGK